MKTRNQKLQGTAYDKRCQRRIYKRSDQPNNVWRQTIDCKADTTWKTFRDTNMTRMLGWRYISSLHSASEPQEGRNNCPLLRSYFIGSCHVGVSKRFSRSISLAVYCLSSWKRELETNIVPLYLVKEKKSIFLFCSPSQWVTNLRCWCTPRTTCTLSKGRRCS